MKKIIFIITLLLVFISDVKAFDIDMSKIDVTSRSDSVVKLLDKKYKIQLDNFNKNIINDRSAIIYTNQLVNASFQDKEREEIKKNLTKYLYINKSDGFDTLSGVIFLDTYLDQLYESSIELGEIVDIKTASFNEENVMSFVYVKNALVNKEKKDIVLSYWLKYENGEYKMYFPWICFSNQINEYFERISYLEETNNVIGDAYNKLSLDGNDNFINKDELLKVYNANKDSVVQITSMSDSTYIYGSGFFLDEGIVVTTWSLFLQFLTEGDYMYVNDCYGNTYEVLGVVSANPDYDVVVLKLNDEVGKAVKFGNSNELYAGQNIFSINSKNNSGFSINYGTNISIKNGKLKNLFALSSSDVGSAIFNEYNEVIAFNVGDKLYSELSYANSTDYLKKLQSKLANTKYRKINYTILEKFKEKYYHNTNKEKKYFEVKNNIWKELNTIGNINDNIEMELVKASYEDKILSLRYVNTTNGILDSIYMASPFTEKLLKEGYKLTFYNEQKTIYENEEYKIILKDNFNYLIVLIMEK